MERHAPVGPRARLFEPQTLLPTGARFGAAAAGHYGKRGHRGDCDYRGGPGSRPRHGLRCRRAAATSTGSASAASTIAPATCPRASRTVSVNTRTITSVKLNARLPGALRLRPRDARG